MPIFVPIALIGWLPVCLVLFAVFPRRIAVIVGVLGAWLFLPAAGLDFRGLPPYTKSSAFGYGILLATMIYTPELFTRLRPSWSDLPASFFCIFLPIMTSLSNGLTLYDGLSGANARLTLWGIPYLIGRVHLDSPRALRDFMVGFAIGGLVYIPFCLFEIAVGPILSSKIFSLRMLMVERLGGWRPRVFMYRGLELGLWMTMCCLTGVWLWRGGGLKRVLGISFGAVWLPALFLTTVLCRSSGALGLLGLGVAIVWLSTRFQQRVWMALLVSSVVVYLSVRVMDAWDYRGLITFLENNFDPDRAQSLEFRFQNEDILIEKAMQRPILGWGGYGRSRVYDAQGKDISVVDGLCVLTLGTSGIAGLATFLGIFILPAAAFVLRIPARRWTEPDVSAMAAAACVCVLYMIDSTQNGFANGVYVVTAGGLASALLADRRSGGRAAIHVDDPARLAVVEPIGASRSLSPEDRLADRYIELARTLRLAGDHQESATARRHALELLTRRAEDAPGDHQAVRRRLDCANDLAWLLATRPDPTPGDRTEAVDLARSTTQADPENPTYWNTLALALSRVGADADALTAARRSMELEAAWNGYDMAVLALADARMGRKDEAAVWLEEAGRWRRGRRGGDPALDDLIREAEAALTS